MAKARRLLLDQAQRRKEQNKREKCVHKYTGPLRALHLLANRLTQHLGSVWFTASRRPRENRNTCTDVW
ncbi:hypothetical protein SRHO_G00129580 [Serrasalmus rhombeus]